MEVSVSTGEILDATDEAVLVSFGEGATKVFDTNIFKGAIPLKPGTRVEIKTAVEPGKQTIEIKHIEIDEQEE